MTTVTLYGRPGCHLCDAVELSILTVAKRYPLDLVHRNIDDDPADYERYKHDIPVVLVNGREIARHRLTVQEFEKVLQECAGRR